MIVIAAGVGLAAVAWYLSTSFETKVLVALGALPFVAWLQVHAGAVPWTLVSTALVAGTAFHAIREAPAPGRRRAAFGLTAMVVLYVAIATAQAFSPDLPSILVGLRGLRLVLEPVAFFFIGAEVARRPALVRRVMAVALVTGAVVVLYAFRQWLFGFDGAEIRHYRGTFAVVLRERRIFSTLPGASALGHEAGLVALAATADILRRRRLGIARPVLAAGALFVVLLTGQRGVILAVGAAGVTVVTLALLRPQWRRSGARAGQALVVVFALVFALVLTTPVQDRRNASAPSRSAFQSARIKLALLRQGSQERSATLRTERLDQTGRALQARPLGAGTGMNLLLDPARSGRSTFLGRAGLGDATTELPLRPLPGELYFYTLASETGLPGLVLWCTLALFGLLTAGGVALRHPDGDKAAFALAGAGYLVVVIVDSFTVDAMAALPVAAWFWLFLGVTGRWAQEDRVVTPVRVALRHAATVGAPT